MNTSTHAVNRTQAWLESLRPRTLPLAFSAMLVGSALAGWQGYFDPVITLLALLTAGLLQILSNLANDYGDAVKGSDQPDRLGPVAARRYHVALLAGALVCLAAFNLLWLHSLWGWLFLLATPLLARQARFVLRETEPAAMRPMLERTVKAALLVNLLFIIGLIVSQQLR